MYITKAHIPCVICCIYSLSLEPLRDVAQADLAELLLKEGAQIAADDWGATPLHRAVARGQLARMPMREATGISSTIYILTT